MAMGLPVVSTAVSAVPEVVNEDTGILVPQRDSIALSAALKRLGSDPALRRAMGEAGSVRIRRDFTPHPGFARLYERLTQTDVARQAA